MATSGTPLAKGGGPTPIPAAYTQRLTMTPAPNASQ